MKAMAGGDQRFERAVAAFYAEHARDPRPAVEGTLQPYAVTEHERLAAWIVRLEPAASEALRLASHCQHLGRWAIPREDHPPGRVGYLTWRKTLARLHAQAAESVLLGVGYDRETIARVRQINLKQSPRDNPDVQSMEDALCLAFLEHEFEAFSLKHPEAQVIEIVLKTWRKMSPRAHGEALALAFSARAQRLVEHALAQAAPRPELTSTNGDPTT